MFTVGHSNHLFDRLLGLLRRHRHHLITPALTARGVGLGQSAAPVSTMPGVRWSARPLSPR